MKNQEAKDGDTISRQAVFDIINVYAEPINGYIGTPNDSEVYAYARGLLLSIERNIRALSSAQPEPKTGKWILKTDEKLDVDYYVCSECGFEPFRRMDATKYCSCCGVKMEGEG